VRPLPRAVDGEEAQRDGLVAVEVVEGAREQLCRRVRGRGRAQGRVDPGRLAEGRRRSLAVDGRRAAEDETADIRLARGVEEDRGAAHVHVHVRRGTFERGPHTRECGEVDDGLGTRFTEGALHRRLVADVTGDEAHRGAEQRLDGTALEPLRIERVEVVDGRHLVAAGEQVCAEMGSDEAGPSGDEDAHHATCRSAAEPLPQRRCQSWNMASVQSGLRRSASPRRWRRNSSWAYRGSKRPEAPSSRSLNSSSKSARKGPRIQAATGMPNPFFGRARISSGTIPRRARLRRILVRVSESLRRQGSRAVYSTTWVSRNGAGNSSEAAIEERSACT